MSNWFFIFAALVSLSVAAVPPTTFKEFVMATATITPVAQYPPYFCYHQYAETENCGFSGMFKEVMTTEMPTDMAAWVATATPEICGKFVQFNERYYREMVWDYLGDADLHQSNAALTAPKKFTEWALMGWAYGFSHYDIENDLAMESGLSYPVGAFLSWAEDKDFATLECYLSSSEVWIRDTSIVGDTGMSINSLKPLCDAWTSDNTVLNTCAVLCSWGTSIKAS